MNQICLYVHNNSTYIGGKLPSSVYQALKRELSFIDEDAIFKIKRMGQEGKKWKWDGRISVVCWNKENCKCAVKKDGTHFPSGVLSKVRAFFDQYGVPYSLVDKRDKVSQTLSLSISPEAEIRDYQQKTINDACNRGRGIVKIATGGGKTFVGSGIIANLNVAPFIFYVTSIDLLKQAKEELSKFIRDNGNPLEVGEIGNGVCNIKDINVMTVQTAIRALDAKYVKYDDEDNSGEDIDALNDKKTVIKDLIRSAKGFIADESQHWSCESAQVISDWSESARYKFGLSATPHRDKGDDLLIDACFGKVIADINASFLIKRGYLIKPEIFFIPVKNGIEGFTYAGVYKQAIVENPIRNAYITKLATTMAQQGRLVLVLCTQITHGKILESLMPDSVFLHGSHSGKVRKEHLEKMRAREAGITIATSIFDEGVDCRPLDTLILAGSGKSQTRALQRVGRVLRPYKGKTSAVVVDFEDHCKYMLNHSRKRKKIYETEPEFNIDYLRM